MNRLSRFSNQFFADKKNPWSTLVELEFLTCSVSQIVRILRVLEKNGFYCIILHVRSESEQIIKVKVLWDKIKVK